MRISDLLVYTAVVSAFHTPSPNQPFCLKPPSTLCNKNQPSRFILQNVPDESQGEDSEPFLTNEDLKNIQDYVADIRAGVYGEERKQELESIKIEEEADFGVDDLKRLLDTRDPKFEREMNQVFDLSNLQTEGGKEVDWEALERKVMDEGKREGINVNELKTIVNSLYRKKGLLNEPFKTVEFPGLKLNWRQSLNNLEIWFTVDPNTKKDAYDVKVLPSTLTITKDGARVLEKTLSGKVDCDGCFWTMYKNPSTGSKYVNINLAKRAPKFTNMWDNLFS